MKPIACFGEALIDFLNSGHQREGELTLNQFTQFPGGAPANAAVAAARLGAETRFLGQVGNDHFGRFLIDSLQRYQVDTRFVLQHKEAKTPLAFVFLDKEGDRSFLFHRSNSADILLEKSQLDDQWFENIGVLHFCSNTLTEPSIAEVTEYALQKARAQNAVISFDVNLRPGLWPTGNIDRDLINRLMPLCQVVKFAREELDYLSAGEPDAYIGALLSQGVELLLTTDGGNPAYYSTVNFHGSIDIPDVNVVDTTAGGDAFIGGVLFGLSQLPSLHDLINNEPLLRALLTFSIQCGAIAVSRPGAFPAMPTMAEVSHLAGFLQESDQ